MFRHHTFDVIPKHFLKKTTTTPCNICYTERMNIFPKGATGYITNLQLGYILYLDFELYNVTSIRKFTSMLNIVCTRTKMIWIFPITYKQAPVRIIRFILTTLNNEKSIQMYDSWWRCLHGKINRCYWAYFWLVYHIPGN